MQSLASFIKERTPKFNKQLVEGLCYHRLKDAISYIDQFIRYSCEQKTDTNLRYLGFKEVTPQEELKFLFNKSNRVTYDIARNDIYLVKFIFQYGEEEEIRESYFYMPFLEKGNSMHMSGNKFLISPVLADKVISIGEQIIFINILTAKYSFNRLHHNVSVDGAFRRVPLVLGELYKNQVKKLQDTTKAKPTIMHYLLANYGYTKTMQMLLGFVPTPVYDYTGSDKVVIASTGLKPRGYIKDASIYEPTKIKFLIDHSQYNEEVLYCIGNLYYVLDNFPDRISIEELDNTTIWRWLLSEIIHTGLHSLSYLNEKINAHFNDLSSDFDIVTRKKLKDIDVDVTNLIELLLVIFKNFNSWMLTSNDRNLYHSKTYEVESYVLSYLTSRITRAVLDINKEEMRTQGGLLESKTVDKIFKKYFGLRSVFGIRKETTFVSTVNYSGDHLYFKRTSIVSEQESDFVNVGVKETNTSERKKIVASMATIGSILGLSKKNPTPLIHLNPYCNIDYNSGTVLPHPQYDNIIESTDKLLANIGVIDEIEDLDTLDSSFMNEFEDDELDDEFEDELDEISD
ncbi:putative RNA polymerase beta subunit [Bacillus phage vB_BspM_AgentSmith]|nr:putative RNA polymerase beta subunit [Bacillus phage vB_BspM_AgentSmith]